MKAANIVTSQTYGKKHKIRLFCWLVALVSLSCTAKNDGFDIVALGTAGGTNSSNLSSFLIAPYGSQSGVACDAGSLVDGIEKAVEQGSFVEANDSIKQKGNTIVLPPSSTHQLTGNVLQNYIKGYLISHSHLDHLAGLIWLIMMGSPFMAEGSPMICTREAISWFTN